MQNGSPWWSLISTNLTDDGKCILRGSAHSHVFQEMAYGETSPPKRTVSPESTAYSAMNIFGGFTNAKNEDWHISWFEQDVFDNFVVFYIWLALILFMAISSSR